MSGETKTPPPPPSPLTSIKFPKESNAHLVYSDDPILEESKLLAKLELPMGELNFSFTKNPGSFNFWWDRECHLPASERKPPPLEEMSDYDPDDSDCGIELDESRLQKMELRERERSEKEKERKLKEEKEAKRIAQEERKKKFAEQKQREKKEQYDVNRALLVSAVEKMAQTEHMAKSNSEDLEILNRELSKFNKTFRYELNPDDLHSIVKAVESYGLTKKVHENLQPLGTYAPRKKLFCVAVACIEELTSPRFVPKFVKGQKLEFVPKYLLHSFLLYFISF